MNKIEIEVPEKQIAEINKQSNGDILIKFKDREFWESIKTVDDAIKYLEDNKICQELILEHDIALSGSYSEKLAAYRIVVAALTNNEKRKLTTGETWFPIVQFCRPEGVKNCFGKEIIGEIISEGKKYLVVGGYASYGASAGLGCFDSDYGVSDSWARVGFRSVSSKKVAEYISKQFGKLLFEVQYRGVNCDWEWID